jgi:hypothetical protein
MSTLQTPPDVEDLVAEMDRLITEMALLRSRLSALGAQPGGPARSVREAEYFGMWADRDDMRGLSSRRWLEDLRSRQWARS